jgi:hypothetical protein
MAEYCLTLICPPTVEEKLLDTLLAHAGSEVFTSTPTFSHGTAPARLSATEQVMGRSRAMQVNVILGTDALAQLRELLQREFAGTGLRWWATAITAEGTFA